MCIRDRYRARPIGGLVHKYCHLWHAGSCRITSYGVVSVEHGVPKFKVTPDESSILHHFFHFVPSICSAPLMQ
eukprot:5106481-Amphidinium_carterae.2